MALLNCTKQHFIMIFDHSAQTEPIVIEFLPSVLSSQRAVKGDCDVTGRVPKSQFTMCCVFFIKSINLLCPENIKSKIVFQNLINQHPTLVFTVLCLGRHSLD